MVALLALLLCAAHRCSLLAAMDALQPCATLYLLADVRGQETFDSLVLLAFLSKTWNKILVTIYSLYKVMRSQTGYLLF